MSVEQNKVLARRPHLEMGNQNKLELADEIIAPDIVWHSPLIPPEMQRGPEGFKLWGRTLRAAFPDYRLTEDLTIGEGDMVVNRWTFRGTQRGEFMGIPPTGKQVTVSGIDIFRIANGKIAEVWQSFDQVSFLQQLGVMSAPEQAAA